MKIPHKIPGLRWMTVLLGIYSAVWISLEGDVSQTVLLGVWVTAVFLLTLLQNRWGGQEMSVGRWWRKTAVLGLLFGSGSALLTLFLMALKTGLHAHGPEFTLAEITWVAQQLPFWSLAGLLTGLAVGLLSTTHLD